MKKYILLTIILWSFFTTWAFASDVEIANDDINSDTNISTTDLPSDDWESVINDLINKYDLVIRNNILESDNEYNWVNYFTSKILTDNIVVPDEIKQSAKRIYFLVEEGVDRLYYAEDAMWKWGTWIDSVQREYNYKIVDYIEWKNEYVFNNKDLVKDFSDDDYRNVQITLMADFSDTQRQALSNPIYISIEDKKSTFATIKNNESEDWYYYSYFNSDNIEKYLENLANKLSRADYKKILEKAEKKVTSTNKTNEDKFNATLWLITMEWDFSKYINSYVEYVDNQSLFSGLWYAVKNQLQNIKAFDTIDAILK